MGETCQSSSSDIVILAHHHLLSRLRMVRPGPGLVRPCLQWKLGIPAGYEAGLVYTCTLVLTVYGMQNSVGRLRRPANSTVAKTFYSVRILCYPPAWERVVLCNDKLFIECLTRGNIGRDNPTLLKFVPSPRRSMEA